MEWFVEPCIVKSGKVGNVVVCTQAKKLGGRRRIAKGNNASGTVLLCQCNGGRTILHKNTVSNIHIQPACGLQMHCSFVRVSTVIIHNLVLIEPTPKGEGFKLKINVGSDGGTCQCIGNAMLLQILEKLHRTVHKPYHFRLTFAGPAIQILFVFRIPITFCCTQPGSNFFQNRIIVGSADDIGIQRNRILGM